MSQRLESGEFEPDPVELLILRNQRAIMRHLVMVSRDPDSTLIDQAKETFDFLKRHDALKPAKEPEQRTVP